MTIQKLKVFQQNEIGERKIEGIRRFGQGLFEIDIISVKDALPAVIDNSTDYISDDFSADIVLDFLNHPDLSYDLAMICSRKKIPIIASGKRSNEKWSLKPPI